MEKLKFYNIYERNSYESKEYKLTRFKNGRKAYVTVINKGKHKGKKLYRLTS